MTRNGQNSRPAETDPYVWSYMDGHAIYSQNKQRTKSFPDTNPAAWLNPMPENFFCKKDFEDSQEKPTQTVWLVDKVCQ